MMSRNTLVAEYFLSTDDDMDTLEHHNTRNVQAAVETLAKHPKANMLMIFDTKNEDVVGTWAKHTDGTIERLN